MAALADGGRVVLLANGLKNSYTARTGFESVYWSAGWWGNRFSSLGIVCSPRHPALLGFPNEGVADWQWRDLCSGATTFLLTGAPAAFRPIVQAVPDFHFNELLGQVFEGRVGSGSLLVCGYDLESRLESRPAARQFRRSLLRYAASEAFRPAVELPREWIQSRCGRSGLQRLGSRILRVDSEDQAHGNVSANLLDGDPATFWHTRWEPVNDPLPHEIVVDLGREMKLGGITCLPRQDQTNGRVAQAEIFGSMRDGEWGKPLGRFQGRDNSEPLVVPFSEPITARYLRIVIQSSVNGEPFAAMAELDIIPADERRSFPN